MVIGPLPSPATCFLTALSQGAVQGRMHLPCLISLLQGSSVTQVLLSHHSDSETCYSLPTASQAPRPVSCTASSPGRLRTSRTSASGSCAATSLKWGTADGGGLLRTACCWCPRHSPLLADFAFTHSAAYSCVSQWHCLPSCVILSHRYILLYPQGCEVCNHLSLFLCVADYDKLPPGELRFRSPALQLQQPATPDVKGRHGRRVTRR